MRKAAKIGYIAGVNSYESNMLRHAIEHYTLELGAIPCIITANDHLVSRCKELMLSKVWSDELPIALCEQVKELVASGAQYIATSVSMRQGFDTCYDCEEIDNAILLNSHERSLYLNLIPLLSGQRYGEKLQILGPTDKIDRLDRTQVEEHTKGCDVPVARTIFYGGIDCDIMESLLTESEGKLHYKMIYAVDKEQSMSDIGHLAVTDFWTERVLFDRRREGFDDRIFMPAPFETVDYDGGQPKIIRLKVYNLELIFARFVAWCSICQPDRLKKRLKTE